MTFKSLSAAQTDSTQKNTKSSDTSIVFRGQNSKPNESLTYLNLLPRENKWIKRIPLPSQEPLTNDCVST